MTKDEKPVMNKIKGYLAYVNLKNSRASKENDKGEIHQEYQATIIMTDENEADKAIDFFKKNKILKQVDTIMKDDFEKKYKFAPPDDMERKAWSITFKQRVSYTDKDGKEVLMNTRPQLKMRVDGNLVDVTQQYEAANGSEGAISFVTSLNKSRNETYAYLGNVLVTKLIPYIRVERDEEGIFDDVQGETKVLDEQLEEVKTDKSTVKSKSKKVEVTDSDPPF